METITGADTITPYIDLSWINNADSDIFELKNYDSITFSHNVNDVIDINDLFKAHTIIPSVSSSGTNSPWILSSNYPYTNVTSGSNITWEPIINNGLSVQGDAEFNGDIKLKGKSLSEVLENIENRLGILHPNPELEEKWEQLKELSVRYKELEKDIIEKEKLWSILKK